jgi:hypothetical protein
MEEARQNRYNRFDAGCPNRIGNGEPHKEALRDAEPGEPGESALNQSSENRMKYWEIIANRLKKAGWSCGCVSTVDSNGRTIWIADAHRGDGKNFVLRGDEELTAFLQPESAIRGR